ncbi:MAG: trehalose-6-phosphate synthase [Candidatus Saganbacteria bacterium]|nr:trehalose-6-phosphate synthase [Candidatus Saganbacteria bacterium]
MWTKESLKQFIEDKLKNNKFIVAANREPYIHRYGVDGIECIKPASGVTTSLDPVLQACNGVWVAHGSGDADKKVVDKKDRVAVPPDNPTYTLRRLWMDKREENGYYYGFSNETLWPLCHTVYEKPKFNEEDWNYYKTINRRFADTILDEIGDSEAFVFLQDYHLCLVPKMIKEAKPSAKVALFWHIPWPNPEAFRICPWKKEILEGLLGVDLLGFHIRYHVDNFLETVNQTLEAKVDKVTSSVVFGGMETRIRPYPISIDYENIKTYSKTQECKDLSAKLKHDLDLNFKYLGVGVDRIDYTKGLVEKFDAIDRFLEKNPQYHGQFSYVQVGALSRIHISSYKQINDEMNSIVEKINWKYSSEHWVPIILIRRHLTPKELIALYKLADLCIVSSLHDGMNLVAKEFIAAVDDDKSLILSQFTGAARELPDALFINPYEPNGFADTIKQALEMPKEEKIERMKRMKEIVAENNIYTWAANVIQALLKIS